LGVKETGVADDVVQMLQRRLRRRVPLVVGPRPAYAQVRDVVRTGKLCEVGARVAVSHSRLQEKHSCVDGSAFNP